jgi:hypothetical protein
MAYYTTRVVLHSHADANDYQVLHNAMAQAGFARVVTGSDGITYELPWAEYLIIGTYKIADVLAAAEGAAAVTGKSDSVLVTEGSTLTWRGLKIKP